MMRGLWLGICLSALCSSALAAAAVQEVNPGVWLIEDHSLPIVTVKIAFENTGAAYDPADRQGLASFASQMLDEGAGDMDSLAFHSALENAAIRFGADASEDIFTVSLQTLSQNKDRAFGLLNTALTKPHFDADAVERVRAGILSELKQMEHNPSYQASLRWKHEAFGTHPYANPRVGTLQSVAAITSQDLKEFASRFSCRSHVTAVVGDITASEVKQWLSTLSLAPAADCAPVPAVADIAITEGGASPVVVDVTVPQTVVTASLPGVLRNDPRYYALVALNHVLGGGTLTARLGKEIRDKRGLAYYAESEVSSFDHAGFVTAQFATRNALANDAVQVFRDELKKISTQGVSEAELNDAKNYLTGSFPLQMDSQTGLAEYLLGMQHFHLGLDYLEKRNALINAVTLAQVNDAARSLLSHPPLIVMAGQPAAKK